jgi:transcription elongation factor GreA
MGTQLSAEAHARLTEELQELSTVGRVDIARQIEQARALGDLSENGDYHAAKESQGKMELRIRQLQATLRDAEIVEATGSDTVVAGTKVTIRYDGDDGSETYLVGSIEEQSEGVEVVSPGSPLGAALLHHGVGEKLTYSTPSGSLLHVEILSID